MRLTKRVTKLEGAGGFRGFHIHVPLDGDNASEIEAAKQLAKSAGKTLLLLSADDMKL